MSIRRFILMASVDPFRPETRQLLARMTTQPTQARAALIDRTIRGLIDAGLWDQFDILYFLAAHDAQAAGLNWKADEFDLTVFSGSPVFTEDGGYVGGQLNTGFAANSEAINWQLGDAALSAWGDNGSASNSVLVGATNAVITPLGSGSSEGATVIAINQSSAAVIVPPATPPSGLLSGSRLGAEAGVYYNGALYTSLSGAENALPSNPFVLLSNTDYRLRFASAGAGRTAEQEAALYDVVSAYLGGL